MATLRAAPRVLASVGRIAVPVVRAAGKSAPRPTSIQFFLSQTQRFQSNGTQEPISTEPPAEGSQASSSASGPAGSDAMKKLEAEVADLKKKLKDSNDNRVYLLAEMENVRRIAKTDVDKAKQYAAQPIAKALLLALDNLTMAVAAIPADKRKNDVAFGNLANGIEATLRIFQKVLGEHGTVEFGAVNDKFDPNKHEAVAMIPAAAEGQSPNTIAHVMKTGFMFKDRVLRPAQVAVFMKAEAAEEAKKATEKVAAESTRSI